MIPIIPIWTKLLIYSFFIILPLKALDHPIYLSSTEIDYKTSSKSLEISVKIFADDLEQVLSKEIGEKIEIGTDKEHPKIKDYLLSYLQKHFNLYTDNKQCSYKYIGHESGGKSDMFAIYIYLLAENIEPFSFIKVKNSILTDNFTNQLNFISFYTNNGIKKVICRKGDLIQELKW